MHRKMIQGVLSIMLAASLGGCTLARQEPVAQAQDRLCGVWIQVSREYTTPDPEGFKDPDACVIMIQKKQQDGAPYTASKVQGALTDTNIAVNATDAGTELSGSATVYTATGGTQFLQLVSLYERADGSVYANTENPTSGAADGTADSSLKQSISRDWSTTADGKTTKESIRFDITMKTLDLLTQLKLVYLDERFALQGEQSLDLRGPADKTQGIKATAPTGCAVVLMEETRTASDGTAKKTCTAFAADSKNAEGIIDMPIILPGDGVLMLPEIIHVQVN